MEEKEENSKDCTSFYQEDEGVRENPMPEKGENMELLKPHPFES